MNKHPSNLIHCIQVITLDGITGYLSIVNGEYEEQHHHHQGKPTFKSRSDTFTALSICCNDIICAATRLCRLAWNLTTCTCTTMAFWRDGCWAHVDPVLWRLQAAHVIIQACQCELIGEPM